MADESQSESPSDGLEDLSRFIARVDSKIGFILEGLRRQTHDMSRAVSSPMAEDCHLKFTPDGLEELSHFNARVDGKIRSMLEGVIAQAHDMTRALEAIQSHQQNMKTRLRDVINIVIKMDNKEAAVEGFADSEEGITLVEALNRYFRKMEEKIDARLNEHCKLFSQATQESKPADDFDKPKSPAKSKEGQELEIEPKNPALSEKGQELDILIEPTGPVTSEEGQQPDIKQKGPAKIEVAQPPNIKPAGPAMSENHQELDKIDLKVSSEGKDTIEGSSEAEENLELEATHPGTFFKFIDSELIRKIRRVDEKIESLLRNTKANRSEMMYAFERIKDSQHCFKARLGRLTEKYFKTSKKDENIEIVSSTARGVLVLMPVFRSLVKEEQVIEARVDECLAMLQVIGPEECRELLDCAEGEKQKENEKPKGDRINVKSSSDSLTGSDAMVPSDGRAQRVISTIISVTVDSKLRSGIDQLSAHDMSQGLENPVDHKLMDLLITEDDRKAIDETSNADIESGDNLLSLQKIFAQSLMYRAKTILVEVSVMLVELPLLLSMNKKRELLRYQAFVSTLNNIEGYRSDAKALKSILEVLKVADEEFRKIAASKAQEEVRRSSETDEDMKMPEAGKLVEELIGRFLILIANLDGLLNNISHLESWVLEDKLVQSFESNMKDMESKVQDIKSNMEVLWIGCSYCDFSPVLVGMARVLAPEQVGWKTLIELLTAVDK